VTLRTKLLLAQAPLGAAIVALGLVSVVTVTSVGETSGRILKDNYRSVLAMQRMKESIERLDSAALFLVAGQRDKGIAQAAAHRSRFEDELEVQEGNITEAGETDMTRRLRAAWTSYLQSFDRFAAAPSAEDYFAALEPRFLAVKSAADQILALNQDAMVHKSDQARRAASSRRDVVTWVSIAALILGLLASVWLLRRLLRPLDRLSMAVRRIAEGDLAARAAVVGTDEIARLAAEFNEMAAHLETYRKSSLGELLQAQQTSQAAIDSLTDPVVVFTVDGGVLASNQAADALLRLDEPGAAPLAMVEPELRATLEQVVDHVRSGRGPYQPRGFEEAVKVPGPEGERHLLPRATPLYGEEGGVAGVTVILQDVTRLRRFDELRNNLVATVAHELRTPLTSLRMAIHLAVEGAAGELTARQLDILGAAREDCERLQTIVDDLLDLARFQSGRVELERRPTGPDGLVAEAIEAHRVEADHRNVRLVAQVTPSLDPVLVDPGRLALVFANLISNALRHTPAGGTVTVAAQPAGSRVKFSISDTGPGIPSEHLPRVFDRFYRVPGTASAGAGLGLSIAREIVEAHGGEIRADNAPAGGATFWFTLPTSAAGIQVAAS
jgi:two-component system, NtrC family, sensor histidine kinase KinB